MRELDERGHELTQHLQHNAGQAPVEDARTSGYIKCILDFLNIEFEESQ